MSVSKIAAVAERLAPEHPMLSEDAADELLRRVLRVHVASEELYELLARLAGVESFDG
jgi:hypothetical protein